MTDLRLIGSGRKEVVTPTDVVLLLQVAFSVQPRGKFNFLETWLFLPLYLLYFQNSLREVPEACKFGVHAIM